MGGCLDRRRRVLLVSKPVAPPWDDSSKNLARDVATLARTVWPTVFTDAVGQRVLSAHGLGRDQLLTVPSVFSRPVPPSWFALGRLLRAPRNELWHFFFAPNRRSSSAARATAWLRRARTVHTVCSQPKRGPEDRRLLFADVTVVLSEHTERALSACSWPAGALRRIAPGVPRLRPLSSGERVRYRRRFGLPEQEAVLLYPGDLEFGDGAPKMLEATARMRCPAHLVMACRPKTPAAAEVQRRLAQSPAARRLGTRLHWVGRTEDILGLVGSADVVALPTVDFYAKMDLPLVLIEAMWMERAVVVAAGSPAEELARGDAAKAVHRTEMLTATLDALCDDDAARLSLGHRAAASAAARYDARRMVAAYEQLYAELAT